MRQNLLYLSQILATNGSEFTCTNGSSQLVRGPASLGSFNNIQPNMISRKTLIVLVAAFSLTPMCTLSAEGTKADRNVAKGLQRDWYREAKFGLFVHWGRYAIPAQEFHDEA